MSAELDHMLVPSRDRRAGAELLAAILDVPWSETGIGPFCPVYVNAGLTLDFDQAQRTFPVQHYCFRVSESEFERIVYWNEPDGHVWEILTVSYARQPQPGANRGR